MSETCKVSSERRGDVAILWTDGYINNQGGEEIAREAYAQLDQGVRALVLNLEKTRIVNSIGISILIEVLEKVMDKQGRARLLRADADDRQDVPDHGAGAVRRDLPDPGGRRSGASSAAGLRPPPP